MTRISANECDADPALAAGVRAIGLSIRPDRRLTVAALVVPKAPGYAGIALIPIGDLSVPDDGIDQVDAQLATVLTDVETPQRSASDLQPEVEVVRASVDEPRTSVDAAASLGDQATALAAPSMNRQHVEYAR